MDKDLLDYQVKIQKDNFTILQECLKKINHEIQNIDYFEDSKNINELLKDIKTQLDNCRSNISNLEKLLNELNDSNNNISNEESIKRYNELLGKIQATSITLNNFLLKYIKETTFTVNNQQKNLEEENKQVEQVNSNEQNTSNHNNPNITIEYTANQNIIKDLINNPQNIENISDIEKKLQSSDYYKDIDVSKDNNILLISEKKNKIFLPYTIEELNKILDRTPSMHSLEDVVNKKYILPLSKYKNGVISRFKETYNLMRKKEKASVTDSFDLALTLAFNFKLNPAIILACKDLEQLDAYLDCLELNELNKFEYFKVHYEISPIKK